ncbi:Clp1-domain-containing protein, partial [Aaosphaeria arxii CBS 175.79]
MLSLPGLNLAAPSSEPTTTSSATLARPQDLPANTEYRFEVAFNRTLSIKLVTGTAELFGTELAPSSAYTFTGTKAAIYTWHGCKLEVTGEVESEYIAEETQMTSYANAHFALEELRERAMSATHNGSADLHGGPRVLVVGPENSGKTSVVKILTAYAVKMGHQPIVLNLDPKQGFLGVPGAFSAAAFSSIIDIEEGWGSSPISGPSPIPVKMPLVYHYGLANTEDGAGQKLFRPLVTRMALAVTSRLEEDSTAKQAGFIVDSPASIAQGKAGVYENIEHIVSEFSINVVFVLGSERLYSDLQRKYTARDPSDPVHVIRLDKTGGAVARDESYMKSLRQAQIREYFFGTGDNTLGPHSHMADFADLNLFRIVDPAESTASAPAGDEYDIYGTGAGVGSIYERVTPSSSIQNSLLAVTTASANEPQDSIRDSSVKGYIYVADVDEAKRKVRLLSPQAGQTPSTAILLGSFPEDVPGLV